jgi:hypothetical protein
MSHSIAPAKGAAKRRKGDGRSQRARRVRPAHALSKNSRTGPSALPSAKPSPDRQASWAPAAAGLVPLGGWGVP